MPTGGDEGEGGSSRGCGNLHSALDEATRIAIDAVDLEKVCLRASVFRLRVI